MIRLLNIFRKSLARKHNQRAVYTCLFGFSEKFMDRPIIKDGLTDYIVFTDDKNLSAKNWKVIYVSSVDLGPPKTSKLVKTCPHLFLSAYETSLYVDNTVRINAAPSDIWAYLSEETPFVVYKHPWWDCPYIETDKVKEYGLADPAALNSQIKRYESEGLPRNAGLFHGGILLRKHSDSKVAALSDSWFNEIKQYTYRDQVALSYLIWREKFKLGHFPGTATEDGLVFWPDDVGPRLPRTFNGDVYLRLNPTIDLQGMSPREHYLKVGFDRGLPWTE